MHLKADSWTGLVRARQLAGAAALAAASAAAFNDLQQLSQNREDLATTAAGLQEEHWQLIAHLSSQVTWLQHVSCVLHLGLLHTLNEFWQLLGTIVVRHRAHHGAAAYGPELCRQQTLAGPGAMHQQQEAKHTLVMPPVILSSVGQNPRPGKVIHAAVGLWVQSSVHNRPVLGM